MISPSPSGPDPAGQTKSAYRIGEMQGTISAEGGRVWLYPREITGRFHRARRGLAWILLAIYLGVPWIHWRGEPLFEIDWFGRKLMLLGHYFWPKDLPIFLPGIFACLLLAIGTTARFGRLWCGWACPQTIFLQFLFGPIERLIEGKSSVRKRRDAGGITFDWAWRKAAKLGIFLGISWWIANTALAYFWGMDNLAWAILHPSARNFPGLMLVLIFTAAFFYIFAYFKEQACIMLCPYARFQSVLLDERTSIIAYDEKRGEPRGKGPGGKRDGLGDCTDCRQCVVVCPTGIDIRQGNQLECIGCARCIDACDQTMAAWKKPKGLVRYASLHELQGKPPGGAHLRLFAYGGLALLMGSVCLILLARRPAIAADLVRRGQSPYERVSADTVRNIYTLFLRNNGSQRRVVRIGWDGDAAGTTNWDGREFAIAGGATATIPVDITVPVSAFNRGRKDAVLALQGEGLDQSIPVGLAGPWGR
jgi:cytochrome c oxidase accessory protein FixG